MNHLLLVGFGGAIGAILRWLLSAAVLHHTPDWRFPIGTFIVNVAGCLAAGILAGIIIRTDAFSADVRLFLFTGLLGGFTTFSAFAVETIYLLRRHEHTVAFAYISLSVICGLAVLWLAIALFIAKPSG